MKEMNLEQMSALEGGGGDSTSITIAILNDLLDVTALNKFLNDLLDFEFEFED